jgi:hypothetical protein
MALKRHIRDQVSKTLTLARTMIPAWSKLTLSQSKVPTNDQRTGIRHPAILVQIKMPRRAEITAAQNRRIELFRVRDPAIAPGFYRHRILSQRSRDLCGDGYQGFKGEAERRRHLNDRSRRRQQACSLYDADPAVVVSVRRASEMNI